MSENAVTGIDFYILKATKAHVCEGTMRVYLTANFRPRKIDRMYLFLNRFLGETMAPLDRAVKELQSERSRLENQLQRVDAALSALNSLNGAGRSRGLRRTGVRRSLRPQRHFSAAARRRMAAAQRARWAKLRQQRSKKAA